MDSGGYEGGSKTRFVGTVRCLEDDDGEHGEHLDVLALG
jgi:hypothetical protein